MYSCTFHDDFYLKFKRINNLNIYFLLSLLKYIVPDMIAFNNNRDKKSNAIAKFTQRNFSLET